MWSLTSKFGFKILTVKLLTVICVSLVSAAVGSVIITLLSVLSCFFSIWFSSFVLSFNSTLQSGSLTSFSTVTVVAALFDLSDSNSSVFLSFVFFVSVAVVVFLFPTGDELVALVSVPDNFTIHVHVHVLYLNICVKLCVTRTCTKYMYE